MKYVRTKDGHIVDTSTYKRVVEREFNGEVIAIDLNHWGQDNDREITWIDVKDIVKQTDTIEELCDRFVYDDNVYYPETKDSCLIEYDYEGNELKITQEMIKKGIYGAIWTGKGLIFVARMNNEGVLELL